MHVTGSKRLDEYSKPVGEKYIDVLDGVRALLVFLVGWFHIWQQSWLTPRFTVLGQMSMRFMLALTMLLFMLSAAFAAPCVRFLLGNRLMRFLSAVSFQFYMYHQVLAVLIKKWGWIPSVSGTPNVSGEWSWQILYTLTCFLVPLALSAALTYGFEKPLIRLSARRKERSDHQKSPA